MKISDRSVRRIVKNKLKLQSAKYYKGQFLTEEMKAKRLQKSRKMLKLVANDRHRAVVFTDEKVFTVERHHNHQNDRQLVRKEEGMGSFVC